MQPPQLVHRRIAQALALHQGLLPLKGPLDKALANHFRQHKKFGSKDRAWLRAVLFAYWRWYGWLREVPLSKAFLLGYLLDSNQIGPEEHAWALHEGLTLTNLLACECPDAFTFPKKLAWMQGLVGALTPQELNPSWVGAWGDDRLAAQQEQAPLWLRLQGIALEPLQAELALQQAIALPHPQVPAACQIQGKVNLDQLPSYIRGQVEVQDLHSQMIGHACNPQPGQTWLDLCAGAGGKSLQLMSLMQGQGQVIACDIRPAPLEEAAHRAQRAGFRQIKFQHWNGEDLPPLPLCEGVLVDAPCSGSGTWRRAPDLRWRFQPSQLAALRATQARLLALGATQVQPGGRLVYATCSLLPEENQALVQDFLTRHPHFRAMQVLLPLAGEPDSLGQTFWPPGGDGIYVAVLESA